MPSIDLAASLGLSVAQRSVSASFSPLSVTPTAWYDPSDLSSMWQDSGGTTPAAVNSPVGKINDKSGSGYHLTQATAGARPVLKQSGSLYWLEFDGVDDVLARATPWASIGETTVAVAAREITRVASGLFGLSGLGTGANTWRALCPYSDGTIYFDVGGFTAPNRLSVSAPFSAGTDFVASFDDSATNSRQFIRVDKSQIAADASGEAVATTTGNLQIGYDGSAGFANARFYGMIVKVGTVLTASELGNVETWLGAKQGRTL